MFKKYLLIIALLLGASLQVLALDMESEKAKLEKQLSAATTAKDSTKLLYDLFDLVPRRDKIPYAHQLYDLATRNNDMEVRLDVLRQLSQLSSVFKNQDSVFVSLNKEIAKLPDSEETRETKLFIGMRQVATKARHATEQECQNKIAELIAQEPNAPKMLEPQRILRLFTIVEYLSNGVQGDMLNEYLGILKERMDQANFNLYALNNIFLTESANIATYSDNIQDAVEADRKLLKVIDGLEKKYRDKGRIYRNYAPNRYITYRRMLSNYEALTPAEIEEYYGAIQKLIAKDPDVRQSEQNTQLAKLYYAMAKKDYATAVPLIQKTLETEKSLIRRRRLLGWLTTASEAIGNKDLQIYALKEFNKTLIERGKVKAAERYRELAIRTKVGELQADKEYLKYKNKQEELRNVKRMMSFVTGGWLLFGLLLIGLIVMWARTRATRSRINRFVNQLAGERDYLKDNLYKDYSKEAGESAEARQPNLKVVQRRERKKDVISMLEYIINDMLYISSIGKWTRKKYIQEVDALTIVEDTVAEVRAFSHSGMQMRIIKPDHKMELRVDKECLQYILRHIIHAADRVADKGFLTIELESIQDDKYVEFRLTNSSVVVPEGLEEIMFDDFIDYNVLIGRKDAGLFISRLNAMLLHSSIRLDRECNEGSRYILSVNTHMDHK